ncbi:MAG: twin-arginine translocase TatA/TatE family subunit [Actinobacteria bacterium]|nr:twin-arginine translocase TatA/TatE family subunit [Actinomycetota bacterium]
MGTQELLIVLIVVLVLFGGSQLPKLARNLGTAQRELKKGMEQGKNPPSEESPDKS